MGNALRGTARQSRRGRGEAQLLNQLQFIEQSITDKMMTYSFLKEDGSVDFTILKESMVARLFAQDGCQLKPVVIDTRSQAVVQDSGTETTSPMIAFTVALELQPIRRGEAVGIKLEPSGYLLLHWFHNELENKAIDPDM
jgi:hypothetical protein